MKNLQKITLLTLCIFCIAIFILSQSVFALSEIINTSKDWTKTGKEHTNTTMDTANLQEKSGDIYNMFLAVATGVAVVVGAMLGLRYMTAGVDKKVEVKESLFPYIVSCIVVFGSLGIWKLVVTILKDF